MAQLKTNFMGLNLKNPIVAGSSGLTSSLNQVRQLEEAGVGAIVLKSLFEEQINNEVYHLLQAGETSGYPDADDYIRHYTRMNSVYKYLELVSESVAAVQVPVMASISCTSASEWTGFATELEKAGASAIELNIYELPINRNKPSELIEKRYIDILRAVKQKTTIPVSVKIAPYFTNLIRLVDQLHANGAGAVTLFNRFYEPDFNLDTLEFISSEVFSSPSDIRELLRWTGLVKGTLPIVEIAASTGIHEGSAAIKQILAGAQVIQLCSALYLNGFDVVRQISDDIKVFMRKWNFSSLESFRGRMSSQNIPDPSVYERAQFMKYFSDRK